MSAVLTRRRPLRARERDPEGARNRAGQESLFGEPASTAAVTGATTAAVTTAAPPAAVTGATTAAVTTAAPPSAAPSPIEAGPSAGTPISATGAAMAAPAEALASAGPSLAEVVCAAWDALLAGEAVCCPACGSPAMQPRHSAGAGVVGGRCGACETTLG